MPKSNPPKKPPKKSSPRSPKKSPGTARKGAGSKGKGRPGHGKQRKYTHAERVAAVLAVDTFGGNAQRAAETMGIPYRTLKGWVDGDSRPYLLELRNAKRGDMAAAFEAVAWQALGLAMGAAKDAPYNHLMTGAGIAFDKMRILGGHATTIEETRTTNVNVDAAEVIKAMPRDQLEQLLALLVQSGGTGESGGSATSPRVGPALSPRVLPDIGEEPDRPL